ncbi:MAG: ribose 5-phosphate isomerase B [Oscillospiraceae bacterium]
MIAIGCDHAAVNLKKAIMAHLDEKQIPYVDLGTDGTSCDYPVIAKAVCETVLSGKAERGILLCGTGIGMSIAANKFKGIRAAVCNDCFSARYTRLHNNANVLCMGERVIGQGLALELVDIFLETDYEGGRHQRRLDIISDIENNQTKE